jgi:proline dehydrogenase
MTLSLGNTEIAFRSQTDGDLRLSYLLFQVFNHPWLVKLGTTILRIALFLRLPVEWLIRRTIFRHFCGGETIETSAARIESLWKYGIGTILDYSAEGRQDEADFDSTMRELVKGIDYAAGKPYVPFCVFKVTGIARFDLLAKLNAGLLLGEQERSEWVRVRQRMETICQRAHQKGVRLFVDAEESWIQDTIDRLAFEMMARFNKDRAIVFNTIQMYRKDRLEFLKKSEQLAATGKYFLGVKLVRGAYMEKERAFAAARGQESCVFPDKAGTDQSYDEGLRFIVQHLDRIALCAGTHNESSTKLLTELMASAKIDRKDPRIFFSQLLGMSDHLSYNLADEGFNVAKYTPYGPVRAVVPYLVRRAEENTSIRGQTGRELSLILEERKRRAGANPVVARSAD